MHSVMVINSMFMIKLNTLVSISLLLFDHSYGMFELIPSGEVYVCTSPNQLKVVCRSNDSRYLQWTLTIPANSRSYTRSILENNVAGFVSPLELDGITFEFLITKNPLTSTALANQVLPILNDSTIMCRELTENGNSAMLVLHVVNTATAGSPTSPVVQVRSEQFGLDNITVILQWLNEGGGVSYSASVTPESLAVEMLTGNVTGHASIELVLLYNTPYNLSIVASLCGVNSTTSITELNYVSCGEPTTNPSVNLQLNSTLVGSRLLLWCGEGDNVTIYTSWCSENATWLPDPAQLVCPLSSLPPSNTFSTLTDSESMLETRKQKETNWMLIGVCLSVGVLFAGVCVAIAILIIIIIIRKGLGCSNNQKENEIKFKDSVTAVEHQEKDINMSKNVVYEQVKCHKQKIVLQENVAYCSTSECVSSGIYNVVY